MQFKCQGIFDFELVDTRTNTIKEKRTGLSNLLLNRWRNDVLAYGGFFNAVHQCHVGDSGTPPERTDTGIVGNLLGTSNSYTITKSFVKDYPGWSRIEYSFEAGTATGTIRELVIGYSTNANSRIVIDPPIEKRDTDKLIVTYTRYVYRQDSWTGVIAGGQLDGTDVSWVCTVNTRQLYKILHDSALNPWLAVRSTPYYNNCAIVGDSNLPSDLENDIPATLKGVKLYEGRVDFYNVEQDNGSYKDITFGFETGTANGQIGEIVLTDDSLLNAFCRFTFTPKLQKNENSRLYLTWRWSIADW